MNKKDYSLMSVYKWLKYALIAVAFSVITCSLTVSADTTNTSNLKDTSVTSALSQTTSNLTAKLDQPSSPFPVVMLKQASKMTFSSNLVGSDNKANIFSSGKDYVALTFNFQSVLDAGSTTIKLSKAGGELPVDLSDNDTFKMVSDTLGGKNLFTYTVKDDSDGSLDVVITPTANVVDKSTDQPGTVTMYIKTRTDEDGKGNAVQDGLQYPINITNSADGQLYDGTVNVNNYAEQTNGTEWFSQSIWGNNGGLPLIGQDGKKMSLDTNAIALTPAANPDTMPDPNPTNKKDDFTYTSQGGDLKYYYTQPEMLAWVQIKTPGETSFMPKGSSLTWTISTSLSDHASDEQKADYKGAFAIENQPKAYAPTGNETDLSNISSIDGVTYNYDDLANGKITVTIPVNKLNTDEDIDVPLVIKAIDGKPSNNKLPGPLIKLSSTVAYQSSNVDNSGKQDTSTTRPYTMTNYADLSYNGNLSLLYRPYMQGYENTWSQAAIDKASEKNQFKPSSDANSTSTVEIGNPNYTPAKGSTATISKTAVLFGTAFDRNTEDRFKDSGGNTIDAVSSDITNFQITNGDDSLAAGTDHKLNLEASNYAKDSDGNDNGGGSAISRSATLHVIPDLYVHFVYGGKTINQMKIQAGPAFSSNTDDFSGDNYGAHKVTDTSADGYKNVYSYYDQATFDKLAGNTANIKGNGLSSATWNDVENAVKNMKTINTVHYDSDNPTKPYVEVTLNSDPDENSINVEYVQDNKGKPGDPIDIKKYPNITVSGKSTDTFDGAKYKKDITGWKYSRTVIDPDSSSITFGNTKTVYYLYTKNADTAEPVTVEYVDKDNQTDQIAKSQDITGQVNDSFDLSKTPWMKSITGWTFAGYDPSQKGTLNATKGRVYKLLYTKNSTPTPTPGPNPEPTPTPNPTPTPVTPTPEPSTPSEPIAKKGEAVYALKKIYLYKNNTFSKSERQAGYSRKPRVYRPMFVVTGYSHSKNGRLRYQVRDVNHLTKNKGKKGYITAQWAYVRPVYYQSSHKTLTVINPRGVNAYTNVNLTGKVRNYKQGTVLHVTKFVKHNLTTRYLLSNGQYITGNRKLVEMGKHKQVRYVKVKKTINRYKTVNLTQRNKHIKKGTKIKVQRYDFSHANSVNNVGALRYKVAGGYITGNSKFVKAYY